MTQWFWFLPRCCLCMTLWILYTSSYMCFALFCCITEVRLWLLSPAHWTREGVSLFFGTHTSMPCGNCVYIYILIHCSKTRIDLYSYFCFIYSVSFSACPHHIFHILGDWDDSVSTSLPRFSMKHPNNSLCSLRSRKQFLEGFGIVFGFFFGSGFGLFLGVLSWYHLPCICNSLELESVILHLICYIWAWLLCILHGICYI
jgi:hypothetical protein